ncbi:hypothetical protein [Mucilaginibacter sp. OK098]|uniref:hypothetical protein n=1 Tax=Mucilaginibacter sp. OK098 TaxID=1855297 RepID=UPI00091D1661|nr:hypothetical protein [Mucilaginibacter sp. OK098]SHN34468.1 DNA helicase/exodeoxyribonuclease V, gamma subunit [Mucilaginibacter sp. OK098]
MIFYNRYINGEDGRSVYSDIYNLRQEAFSDKYFDDIQSVLTETFNRVVFNLEIIFSELKNINYAFKTEFQCNSERPLLRPLPDTDELLVKLNSATSDFGQIPLSLKLFYKIVGSCNFAWDYDNRPEMFWKCADPIQINSIDDIVNYVSDDDWTEYLSEALEDDNSQSPYLELAADYLHKDNISGGPPYSIQLTKEPSIDGLFLNEPNETTFINYLRICMENCGFSRITNAEYENDYKEFFAKIKPQLKNI